jgi:hypothetical protein
MTLTGAAVYSVSAPGGASCTSDSGGISNGVGRGPAPGTPRCGFALDADGTLAVATTGASGLYWASPAQPQLHSIAVTVISPPVAIANDEIVYLAPAASGSEQLALTGLSGNSRPISAPIADGPNGVYGLAFDGASVAWAGTGCVYAGSVPTGSPAGPASPACQVVTVNGGGLGSKSTASSVKVASHGQLAISVSCTLSPCSGSLTLSTEVKKVTGKGRHRKTKGTRVTIATAVFSALAVSEQDSVALKLNATGLKLLERDGSLSATVTSAVPLASSSQRDSETVMLKLSRRK